MYTHIKSSVVHFKYLTILFVNYTLIKLENKVDVFSVVHELLTPKTAELPPKAAAKDVEILDKSYVSPMKMGINRFSLHDYCKDGMRSNLNCLTYH